MSVGSSVRYGMVAAFCLVLNNAVIIAADASGLGTAAAVLLSFAIVLTSGYLLHCGFTFREAPTWMRFRKYSAGMAFNIPLAFTLIWILHDVTKFRMIVASPLTSAIMVLANYALSRWAIASSPSPAEKNP